MHTRGPHKRQAAIQPQETWKTARNINNGLHCTVNNSLHHILKGLGTIKFTPASFYPPPPLVYSLWKIK
uniref:Uncharacterized protein n=1 Tax=Anguilla anguilla TaxID=7936 RepID=A0A0E9W566_ANGAN